MRRGRLADADFAQTVCARNTSPRAFRASLTRRLNCTGVTATVSFGAGSVSSSVRPCRPATASLLRLARLTLSFWPYRERFLRNRRRPRSLCQPAQVDPLLRAGGAFWLASFEDPRPAMIAHPRALRPRRRPATSTCFTRELKRPSNTATADPPLTVAAPSASRLQVPDLRQLRLQLRP